MNIQIFGTNKCFHKANIDKMICSTIISFSEININENVEMLQLSEINQNWPNDQGCADSEQGYIILDLQGTEKQPTKNNVPRPSQWRKGCSQPHSEN